MGRARPWTAAGQGKRRQIDLWFEPRAGVTDEGERLTIDGRPARLEGGYLQVFYPDLLLQLNANDAGLTQPRAEVLRIKKHLTLANPWDRSTWLASDVGL